MRRDELGRRNFDARSGTITANIDHSAAFPENLLWLVGSVCVGVWTLLGRTHLRLFLQRVLQTIDAGVPRRSRCSVSSLYPQAHCSRNLRRSHRLADRSLWSATRDPNRYWNFWFDLACESAPFRQHRSVLLFLLSLGLLSRRCWPNTLRILNCTLVRQIPRPGSGPDDVRHRSWSRGHASRRSNTDRPIRLDDGILNSWSTGPNRLLAGGGLLVERRPHGRRSPS